MSKFKFLLNSIPRISLFHIVRGLLLNPLLAFQALAGKDVSSIDFKKILSLLPNEPTIIEAGAGSGQHSLLFLQHRPKANLICFEPVEEQYKLLKAKVGNKASCYQMALSKSGQKKAKFFISPKNESSSLLQPTLHLKVFKNVKFADKPIEVVTISLDEIVEDHKLKKVDLLWLDLQGAELMVLREGGLKTLKMTKFIYLEISNASMYDGATIFEEIKTFMESNYYYLYDFKIPFIFGNALFVNKKFKLLNEKIELV